MGVVTRLHLRVAHGHVLPVIVLYCLTLAVVDIGAVFEMSPSLAIGVYSGQVVLSIAAFYIMLVGNLFGITQLYVRLEYPWVRIRVTDGRTLTYVCFLGRVIMLSFVEAASVSMLVMTILGVHPDLSRVRVSLVPLGVALVAAHVGTERKHLGKAALIVEEK